MDSSGFPVKYMRSDIPLCSVVIVECINGKPSLAIYLCSMWLVTIMFYRPAMFSELSYSNSLATTTRNLVNYR